MSDYRDLAGEILKSVRAKGADAADMIVSEGTEFSVTVRRGEVETLTEAGSKALGVRVFVGTRTASTYTSDFSWPTLARLLKNYPNPFNPRTKIRFTLKRDAQALLRVYDVRGRLIRTLVDSYVAAGSRTVEWDGTDDRGISMASGTYFLRLDAGGDYESRTVTLLK